MVGSALVRALNGLGCSNIVTRTRDELDLCNQAQTTAFFETEKPDVVLFAAARVGGIHANNTYPAEFIYQNLMMAGNAIHAAHVSGHKGFCFWAAPASTPEWPPSQCRKRAC